MLFIYRNIGSNKTIEKNSEIYGLAVGIREYRMHRYKHHSLGRLVFRARPASHGLEIETFYSISVCESFTMCVSSCDVLRGSRNLLLVEKGGKLLGRYFTGGRQLITFTQKDN